MKSSETTLTPKQKRFVACYRGNGVAAAREAGYRGKNGTLAVTAHDLLQMSKIQEIIKAREDVRNDNLIAKREDRQRFWTSVMLDVSQPMMARLRASELLGRSEGDFFESRHTDYHPERLGVIRYPAKVPVGTPVSYEKSD